MPVEAVKERLVKTLKPFILDRDDPKEVIVRLPPEKRLMLRFVFKDKRTKVLIRSDSEGVLHWIDDFFDSWVD
jgi:hypothetical protein